MEKWSIGVKILVGYGAALLITLIVSTVSHQATGAFMADVEVRKRTGDFLIHLERLLSSVYAAESAQRAFLLTGKELHQGEYNVWRESARRELEELETLGETEPEYHDTWSRLQDLANQWFDEVADAADLRAAERGSGAAVPERKGGVVVGRKALEDILAIVGSVQKREEDRRDSLSERMRNSARFTTYAAYGGTGAAFLVLFLAGGLTTMSITRPLGSAINLLTTSAGQIAAAAEQVAVSATEAATAVAQTTTTVAEVKQTALTSVQKARHVADSSQHTAQASQQGMQAVEQMMAGINHIREQTDSVAASIVRLSEQSQAIGAIIATVDDLAAQSNLLAVNAAIEAAKAGEQGKGFAVVAQEVKSLAEQSKQATAQVRTILNDIQKATSAAVMATDQSSKAVEAGLRQACEAGQSVRTLSDSINESAQAAVQIAASSEQQLVGMDQLAHAMEDIRQGSVQNANSTKQTGEAARSLNELARDLKRLVAGGR